MRRIHVTEIRDGERVPIDDVTAKLVRILSEIEDGHRSYAVGELEAILNG